MESFSDDPKLLELLHQQFVRYLAEDDERILFAIGVSLVPMPRGTSAYAPYHKLGSELWSALRYEIYQHFCDTGKCEPKEWLKDLISGDTRNLMVGVVSAITAQFEVGLAIALPAAALVVKNRAMAFCSTPPLPATGRSLRDILSAYRERERRVAELDKKASAPSKGRRRR